jgi:hypothetical protein
MSSIFFFDDDGFYPHCFRIGPGEVFGIVFFFPPLLFSPFCAVSAMIWTIRDGKVLLRREVYA